MTKGPTIRAGCRWGRQINRCASRIALVRGIDTPEAVEEFRRAYTEAEKLQNTDAPQVAEHLAKHVNDAELTRKIRTATSQAPLI
jgi:hypothetical protein